MRLLVSLLAVALACAAEAHAHGGGSHTGFVSTVSAIEPPQLGLLVQVLGGHERLSVRNLTQKTVVLFDERGRPALRLAPGEAKSTADPRIGSSGRPPAQGEFVKNWRIRGEVDGEPFTIRGFLGYRAPPAAGREDGGLPVWAIVLAGAGGAAVMAAALALPLRRREGEG